MPKVFPGAFDEHEMMLELEPEQRIVLQSCSWETYERILLEQAGRSLPRLCYDEGQLELMSPSPEHERACAALRHIVCLACDHLGREFDDIGTTTIRRQRVHKGAEADAWFYLDRYGCDPDLEPPDLAIEVEASRSALDKLPILAAIGVLELWRTDLRRVQILCLQNGVYQTAERSGCLPFSSEQLSRLLILRGQQSRSQWIRSVLEELASA